MFPGGLGEGPGIGHDLLLIAGHGGGGVQQQKIGHRGPGLPHRLQIAGGGEGPRADAGLRLGEGRLAAGDVHIGVQGVPLHEGPDHLRRCRGQGAAPQCRRQDHR